MSNRSDRRAAERAALKAMRQFRNQNPPATNQAAIEARRQFIDNLIRTGVSGKPFPETPDNNSAQNATKHGCCSESILIMKSENLADFQALHATWFKAYNPKDDAEAEMVQQLVESRWYEKRCLRKLAEMETHLMDSGSPFEWTEEQQKTLARFQRYATARTNAVIKATKALEDYRKNRNNEVVKVKKQEINDKKAEQKEGDDMSVEECMLEMEDLAELRRRTAEIEKELGI
jgi:hypothetical protein